MKNKIQILWVVLAITVNGSIIAQTYYPQKQNSKIKVKPAIPLKAYAFDPKDVRVTGGIFLKAMKADENYLLYLSPDRFLNRFHKNAGLPPRYESSRCGSRTKFNMNVLGQRCRKGI